MPDVFAAVTVKSIRTHGYVVGATHHAKRVGPNIELRPGARPCTQLVYSIHEEDPRDYGLAFAKNKLATGARERGGAQFGMHLIYVVSPSWLEATGGIHDPDNPRVQALFEAAIASAQKHLGGVVAARCDLDEAGGGNVDVFRAPVHTRPGRPKKDGSRGPDTLEISPRKSLQALQARYGTKNGFAALQSAWAEDMQAIDPTILRGRPKAETGREHLDVPEFKKLKEEEELGRAILDFDAVVRRLTRAPSVTGPRTASRDLGRVER